MNFAFIIDKYPGEREAITRLAQLLDDPSKGNAEFTLNRFCDLLHPRSREGLASALGELVRQGIFKQIVRVVSPATQGGIKDFDSLEEVPESLHDWRSDTDIEVTPQNLRVVYKVTPASTHDRSRTAGGD